MCPLHVAYEGESWEQGTAGWCPEPRVSQGTRFSMCTHIHTSIHAHIHVVMVIILNDGSELQHDNGLLPS